MRINGLMSINCERRVICPHMIFTIINRSIINTLARILRSSNDAVSRIDRSSHDCETRLEGLYDARNNLRVR